MSDQKIASDELKYYYMLAATGVEMVIPLVLGLLLDRWWNCFPWLTITGAVIGPLGAVFHMLRLVRQFERRKKDSGESAKE